MSWWGVVLLVWSCFAVAAALALGRCLHLAERLERARRAGPSRRPLVAGRLPSPYRGA